MKSKQFSILLLSITLFTNCTTTSNNDPVVEPSISNVTDIDGNVYQTVKIGTQIWTQKNLNVSNYRNGDAIPQVQTPSDFSGLTTGAWCYYENGPDATDEVYGKLYNWFAVNDPRGLAPEGYHVPSDTEWTTVVSYLGGISVAGGKMKATGTLLWSSPNEEATNSSGFTGLPGGFREWTGVSGGIESGGYWWSSTGDGPLGAWNFSLAAGNGGAYRNSQRTTIGNSIRCLKD